MALCQSACNSKNFYVSIFLHYKYSSFIEIQGQCDDKRVARNVMDSELLQEITVMK